MLELCNIFQEIIITVLHYYDIYGQLQYNVFHFYYNENYLCINLHQIKKTKRKKEKVFPPYSLFSKLDDNNQRIFSVFLSYYFTICTIHLSVYYDTQCKTCSTTKNFVAVNKKKQVIETKFLCLCYFFLSRQLWVVKFSIGAYKIRKTFSKESTCPKEIIEF